MSEYHENGQWCFDLNTEYNDSKVVNNKTELRNYIIQ